MAKYSVEMTSAGENHGRRDVQAASPAEAVALFLADEGRCIFLEEIPSNFDSNYADWQQLVISVSPPIKEE